jgi:predicted RNase H-like nuclease (RuvC/YqgF family)
MAGSLSESKNESVAHPATGEASLQENEQLQKELSISQESVKALTSSLAESNAAAEELRRKYSDLELRMEALGLASVSKDRAKLEQRLLSAVSDLQLTQKERDEYRDQMLRLNEAILCYLKTSQGGDAKARMDVEAQLRSTNTLITKSASDPGVAESSLMDGSVISVKDEWSFVVGNLGEKQGVKIGMPMRVMRDDRKIATVRVVDVRQKICGAVIQEMDSKKEQIKVGDRLQVDAQPDVSLK